MVLPPSRGARPANDYTFHADDKPQKFIRPVSLALWNARSLWAHGEMESLDFALQLASGHDITIITETRGNAERHAILKARMPGSMQCFLSGFS